MPDDFAPAFGETIYGYETAAGQGVVDVEVLGPDGGLLGIKRFAAGAPVEANIAGYLQKELAPQPVMSGECAFLHDAGRSVAARVRVGGEVSPQRVFTAGIEPAGEYGLLSVLSAERELAPGQYDELSLAVPGNIMSAKIMVAGDVDFEIAFGEFTISKGIIVFRVDAGDIASKAVMAGTSFERCTLAELVLFAGGTRIMEVRYALKPAAAAGKRIAWLNRLGGVDYHTFRVVNDETVSVTKERYLSGGAHRVASSQSSRGMEITSGYYPAAVMKALAGIACSPLVWLIEGDTAVPVDVLSEKITLDGDSLPCLRFSIRECGVEDFQRF